jgi:hypothetical protein
MDLCGQAPSVKPVHAQYMNELREHPRKWRHTVNSLEHADQDVALIFPPPCRIVNNAVQVKVYVVVFVSGEKWPGNRDSRQRT